MIESGRDLALSDQHLGWIQEMADAQAPPVSATAMLGHLVEEAMARHGDETRRREEQLEVYSASGYSEHHPDYPDLPRELLDA